MPIRIWRAVASTAALLTIGTSSLVAASPPVDVGTSGEVPTVPTVAGRDPAPVAEPIDVEPLDVEDVDKEVDVPPVIHCVWVVADMVADEGVQRLDDGRSDDLPEVPTPTPCSSDPASGASIVVDSPGPAVHVRPWSGDQPEARTIEIWAVTSHAAGPQAVTSVNARVLSDTVALEPGPLAPVDGDVAREAVDAGRANGQIAALPADDIVGMLDDGWGVAHRSVLRLSMLDGCGAVTLVLDAAAGDATRSAAVAFDVPCYHHLVADFDTVDWGVLVRGAENIVPGDLDPTSGDRPTVRNLGNAPLGLVASFEPLCPVGSDVGCIGSFGVEVSSPDVDLVRVPPQQPGTSLRPDVGVCPGGAVSLDLVVDITDRAGGGDYVGSMSVVGEPVDIACPVDADSGASPTTVGPSSKVATTVPTTHVDNSVVDTTPATSEPATSEPAASSVPSSTIATDP